MRRLPCLLSMACLGLSLNSFATDKAAEKFQEHKARALENIQARQSKLNEHKSCIESAADNEALKQCRVHGRHERHEMRKERREKRAQRRQERDSQAAEQTP